MSQKQHNKFSSGQFKAWSDGYIEQLRLAFWWNRYACSTLRFYLVFEETEQTNHSPESNLFPTRIMNTPTSVMYAGRVEQA